MKFYLLLVCLLFAKDSYALRCGHHLVDRGNYQDQVVDKCGDPVSIESHLERKLIQSPTHVGNRFTSNGLLYGQQQLLEIDVVVEEWLYDFGRTRFRQLLRFENGVLTEITSLGRGD